MFSRIEVSWLLGQSRDRIHRSLTPRSESYPINSSLSCVTAVSKPEDDVRGRNFLDTSFRIRLTFDRVMPTGLCYKRWRDNLEFISDDLESSRSSSINTMQHLFCKISCFGSLLAHCSTRSLSSFLVPSLPLHSLQVVCIFS